MRNLLFTIMVVCLIAPLATAQKNKGYVGISIGSSTPLGDLSSKDLDNDAAGFADAGAVVDISFAYKLGEGNFGVAGVIRGQANPLDVQAIVDEFAKEVPGVNWSLESDGWGIGGLMVGGYGAFPISEKTSFEARALIGFLTTSSPEMTVTGSVPGAAIWVKQATASASSFSFNLGAGFRFNLGEKVCLLTSMDYLGSNPEFSNVVTTSSDGDRTTDTWSQSMGTFNVSLGIGVRL
jgi:hypothetical protein